MPEETAVLDAGTGVDTSTAVDTTSQPVESTASGVVDLSKPAENAQVVDPNDPFAALQSAMDAALPKDDAVDPNAQPPDGQNAAIPEQFQQALEISPFVTSPESVQQAVRAADEVWQVATGQIPARQMLEGFKNTNPEQFQAIVADLKDYLGVTGAQPSPLAELQQANPAAFKQIADFYKATTGKDLGGAPDPNQARLDAIEQRFRQDEENRQTAIINQQVDFARSKASEFIANATKNTFADGLTDRFVAPGTGLLWQKAQQMNIAPDRLTQELLQGNTATLDKLFKAVQKDEIAILKQYNANLIKAHRTLANGVPASKGGAVKAQSANGISSRKDGESDIDYATRLWKEGQK